MSSHSCCSILDGGDVKAHRQSVLTVDLSMKILRSGGAAI